MTFCIACNKAFKNKHSLANHKYKLHSKNKQADPQTVRPEMYVNDSEDSSRVSCPICSKDFANKHTLASHKYQYHSKKSMETNEEDEYLDRPMKNKQYYEDDQFFERILEDLFWVCRMFWENDYNELKHRIKELRHAAFAILSVPRFEKQLRNVNDVLDELCTATIFEGQYLLIQHYRRLKKAFNSIDPGKVKDLIQDCRSGLITWED